MLLEPECIGCMLDQIYKALRLLRPSISNKKIIETQKKMMEYLTKVDILKKSGPLIGKKAYQLVAEVLGEIDPYKLIKEKYNRLALKYYDEIKDLVEKSEDSLFEAIAIAAIGNTIDFGAPHEIDLINDLKNFSPENLKINDIPNFKNSLKKAEHLLILNKDI